MKAETIKELEDLNNGIRTLVNELSSITARTSSVAFALKDILDKEKRDSPKVSIDKLARERAEKIFRGIVSISVSPRTTSDEIDAWLKEFGSFQMETYQERTERILKESLADNAKKLADRLFPKKDPSPLKNQKEEEEGKKPETWVEKEERRHKEDINRFADHCKTLADRLLAKKDPSPKSQEVDKTATFALLDEAVQLLKTISEINVKDGFSSERIFWLSEKAHTFVSKYEHLQKNKENQSVKSKKEDGDACDCPRCTLERMIEEGIRSGKYTRNGHAIVLNGPENIDELFEKLFEGLCAAKEKSRGFFF